MTELELLRFEDLVNTNCMLTVLYKFIRNNNKSAITKIFHNFYRKSEKNTDVTVQPKLSNSDKS